MERFSNSPSSEDFEIVRSALGRSGLQGTVDEIRAQFIQAVSALLPDHQIDIEMIDALVRTCNLVVLNPTVPSSD